jgi:hypothetical protein
MRSNVLMHPSVTRNVAELERDIVRYRRRRLLRMWGPLLIGVAVFALLIGFLLSDTGHNFLVWMDGI